MDVPATIRRRRRRRVPDDKRKRAPRACDRCKARKSKCIEAKSGKCQRCETNSLACHFERERSPLDLTADVIRTTVAATIDGDDWSINSGPDGMSPEDPTERFMWPQFLSRLRETFSLDSETTRQGGQASIVQPQSSRPSVLQPAELQRLQKAVDAFPPRSVGDFLLSVCIQHGTDAFFYFNQSEFMAEINEFYTNPLSRLRHDCSFVCLAHAAFALGSQWTTLARPEGSTPESLPHDGDPGRIFYNHARSLIPDVIDVPSLRSVQAPFVMGVYLLPASAIGPSYIYLGMALRKAMALDLHLTSEDLNISDEEKEIRSRIWWSIYSLERSSTVKLNRPRSVNTAIITAPLPQRYPALDQVQIFNNIEHQIADAKLMVILDRVSEPLEWPTGNGMLSVLESELKIWKRSIPPSLRLQNIEPRSSSYRATFHLYSNYYFTWIAMGKVSVVTIVRARLRYYFGKDPQPPRLEAHVENLARSCIKAARKMLHLFEELRGTGNLTRFSFTDFQACSIATIVLVLAGVLERDSDYKAQIAFGLDCLRKMAEGNAAAKMGVSFVEALQSIANEAVETLKQSVLYSRSAAPCEPSQATEYSGWVEWLSEQGQLPTDSEGVARTPTHIMQDAPTPRRGPWRQISPTTVTFTSWDGATALQQLSGPALGPSASTQESQNAPFFSHGTDPSFLSTLYSDDQTFLMGLTGMDVLGFPDFQEQGTGV